MSEWSWPFEGPYAEFIHAHSLPNFAKYAKTEVVQPHLEKSKYTMPKSPWNMPYSYASYKENENIDFIGLFTMNIDRFMTKNMVNRLQEMVKNGKISEDDKIPTEQAVKSWISRFSKSLKELSAAEVLTSETSA
ncbi:6080_t:CDS:2 [Cetraspora pellucida]|uniref:6080_t:CDS:1 n=1 Tax=Cetraspora pellucida TaxID=1433469 RepID=A0A9N9ICZ3_9GLOM|nr:6080_t:CDS:2 [Cetraspora pellucida]